MSKVVNIADARKAKQEKEARYAKIQGVIESVFARLASFAEKNPSSLTLKMALDTYKRFNELVGPEFVCLVRQTVTSHACYGYKMDYFMWTDPSTKDQTAIDKSRFLSFGCHPVIVQDKPLPEHFISLHEARKKFIEYTGLWKNQDVTQGILLMELIEVLYNNGFAAIDIEWSQENGVISEADMLFYATPDNKKGLTNEVAFICFDFNSIVDYNERTLRPLASMPTMNHELFPS